MSEALRGNPTKEVLRARLIVLQVINDKLEKRVASLEAQTAYLIRGNMGMHDWLAHKIREIDTKFQERLRRDA